MSHSPNVSPTRLKTFLMLTVTVLIGPLVNNNIIMIYNICVTLIKTKVTKCLTYQTKTQHSCSDLVNTVVHFHFDVLCHNILSHT